MSLQDEISEQSSQIRTDSYQMSVGEILNLYSDHEIDIHPEFQRVYRWSNSQKTRLIESILLGIPIPPIFVAQRKNGVWDVVDGQQRLSTIIEFIGDLRNEDGETLPALALEKTKFLPSLEGKTWDGENSFTRDQKLFVKRAKIDVKIVLKESDDNAKYELFMRLNTGGTPLMAQEVRNCLMIMAYPETYEWVRKLSEMPSFLDAVAVSDRAISEAYPMELATRFLLFRTLDREMLSGVGDIGDYLNENLSELDQMDGPRRALEEKSMESTFGFIADSMGDKAFKKYDVSSDRFKGGFLISSFEAVALGVGYNVDAYGMYQGGSDFEDKVKSLWQDPEFTSNSGSGVRASSRLPKILPLGRSLFKR